MEYEQEYKKNYTSSLLIRQVQEQNVDFCDVPVQVGTWVKRFHSCVLVGSGFFDKLIQTSKFREHTSGVIEIREKRSNVVDEAIMFLYNVGPDLDTQNIGDFLDIAEFLLIPRLKAFCVKWLEQTKKSATMIAVCLPICALYDFDIPSVIDYIRQNLIDLMNGSELLNINADSLQNLLLDKYLSYVLTETKFNFLIRWVKIDPLNRFQYFKALCEWVDFRRLSQTTITSAKEDPLIGLTRKLSEYKFEQKHGEMKEYMAMIAKYQDLGNDKDMVIIYDEQEKEWFRLNVNMTYSRQSKYFTNSNDNSTFYRVCEDSSKDIVIELCYSDGKIVTQSKVTVKSYENKTTNCGDGIFESICIQGSTCVATRIDTLKVKNGMDASDYGYEYHQIHGEPLDLTVNCTYDDIRVMQLLVGYIKTTSDTTILYPIFSMKMDDGDYLVDKCCLNTNGSVALIISTVFSTFVCIYNIDTCTLIEIEVLGVSKDSTIHYFPNGFAINNEFDITLVRDTQDTSNIQYFDDVTAGCLDPEIEKKNFCN